jgi:hypothetical protein
MIPSTLRARLIEELKMNLLLGAGVELRQAPLERLVDDLLETIAAATPAEIIEEGDHLLGSSFLWADTQGSKATEHMVRRITGADAVVRGRMQVEIDNLTAQRDLAEATLRAYIASVEEMELGVGLPDMFTVMHEGKTYAAKPDDARSFYQAIADKWARDNTALVALFVGKDARLAALYEALQEMAEANTVYRRLNEHAGSGALETGQAWDRMRRGTEKARHLLAQRS